MWRTLLLFVFAVTIMVTGTVFASPDPSPSPTSLVLPTPNASPSPPILELVSTVTLPAIPAFSATDHFRTKDTPDGVKLNMLTDNFCLYFLAKKEAALPAAILHIYRLGKDSGDASDTSIIRALGGAKVAETTLGQFWEMLKRQPQGQAGDLWVNGYCWNIFYIRDARDELRVVGCFWNTEINAWDIGEAALSPPGVENAPEMGSQFVSH